MAWSGYSETGQGSDERGPKTFTMQPPGTVQADARGPVGVRDSSNKVADLGGVKIGPAPVVDRTVDVLLGFAKEKAAPMVKQMEEEAFLTGMQRAASGEALTDIVNSQPWYSGIFGDAPLVEGARTFEVQTGVTNWLTEQEARMPELRRQSPDQIPQLLLDATKKLQTGDARADTMMQMEIIKRVPDFIKVHTREHYKYLQEQAVETRMNSWQAQASSLQIAYQAQEGMISPEELERRQGNLIEALVPTPGANPDTWENNVVQFAAWAADTGNFHTLDLLTKSGTVGAMRAEDRAKLDKHVRVAKARHASEALSNYAEEIIKLRTDADSGLISGEKLMAAFDAMDDSYRKTSGNDHALIPKGERVSGGMSALRAVKAAQRAAAKEVLKADSAELADATLRQGFAVSTSKDLELNGVKRADVNRVGKQIYQALPDLPSKAAFLVADSRGGNAIDTIKADIDVLVGSAASDTVTDNFLEAHRLYQAIRNHTAGGAEAVAQYFGPDVARRLDDFSMQLGGRDPAVYGEAAFQLSKKNRMAPGYTMDKKEQTSALSFVDDEVRNNAWYKFGVGSMTESSKKTVLNAMAGPMGQIKNGTPSEFLNKQAFAYAKANGLELWGKHAWFADKSRPRLDDYLKDIAVDDPRIIGQNIDSLVDERLKTFTDKDIKDVLVLRAADSNGKANFQVIAYTEDGMLPPTTFDTDDLRGRITQDRQERIAKRKPGTKQNDVGPIDVTKPYIGYRP